LLDALVEVAQLMHRDRHSASSILPFSKCEAGLCPKLRALIDKVRGPGAPS
jgi:hypothetical protein